MLFIYYFQENYFFPNEFYSSILDKYNSIVDLQETASPTET